MDIIAQINARPMAVKLALGILAFDQGVAFVMNVVDFQASHYVMFGSWLIEDIFLFVVLWCAFRGKNWARWLMVVWTVLFDICISLLLYQFQFEIALFRTGRQRRTCRNDTT